MVAGRRASPKPRRSGCSLGWKTDEPSTPGQPYLRDSFDASAAGYLRRLRLRLEDPLHRRQQPRAAGTVRLLHQRPG
ncbi:hypothetical protein AO967_33575, partial [Pseudomonas aeruginosa]